MLVLIHNHFEVLETHEIVHCAHYLTEPVIHDAQNRLLIVENLSVEYLDADIDFVCENGLFLLFFFFS